MGDRLLSDGLDGQEEAEHWYEKAAAQGHALAQFHLGAFLWTQRDKPLEAEKWLKKAADQGNIDAHLGLAQLYQRAEPLKNPALEAKFLRVAAEAGNAKAQSRLGVLLADMAQTPEVVKDTQVRDKK